MSFASADASRYANLCILALCNKTTEARLRLAGEDTAKKSTLPPGHGKDSPYTALTTVARKQHLRNREARKDMTAIAVTVALDLLDHAGAFARRQDLQDALTAYNSRTTAPTRKAEAMAEDHPMRVSSRNRANGYVVEDDEDPDPTPSAPAGRQYTRHFLADVANWGDDFDEVERGMADARIAGVAA